MYFQNKNIYIIGISGIGTSGLAMFLNEKNIKQANGYIFHSVNYNPIDSSQTAGYDQIEAGRDAA